VARRSRPTTLVQPPATASALAPARPRLSDIERRRLGELFAELCRIESPSGSERACAERVVAELHGLGLEVHEDDAGVECVSECGNLLARIPARTEAAPLSMLLCAHLDTVPPQAPVEPVLVDGGWQNANEGILGADNKAAVAVLLVLARRLVAEGAPVDVELLFTVCEERSLAGAHALDRARLRSECGYVFDHASPIGEVVVASPCHFRLDVEFRGTAAHAGVRPEEGSSAILAAARAVADMPLGRIDAHTTANVGRIEGGSAINVVPERCRLVAEVRSLREEAAEATVAEIVDCVHEAANLPDCDCDVDIGVRRGFSGYTLPGSAPAVQAAELALRGCGYSPTRISSGGASDANALIAKGLEVVNLANGTERPHEPGERVSTAALEGMLEVALALPGAVAAQSKPATR
jgi:tripeptide aminopeptidase